MVARRKARRVAASNGRFRLASRRIAGAWSVASSSAIVSRFRSNLVSSPGSATGAGALGPLAGDGGKTVEALWLLSAVAVVQAALVPYDFTLPGNHASITLASWWREARLSIPDFLSNVALYAPFGFLGAWTRVRRGGGTYSAWGAVVVGAAVLSAALEGFQLFSASRVSSPIDVGANAIGALVGAIAARFAALAWSRRAEVVRRPTTFGPAVAALRRYALILVVVGTAPWTLSMDAGRLRDAVHRSSWTPFQAGAQASTADAAGALDQNWSAAIERHHAWAGWIAETALFALLAHLLWNAMRVELGFGLGAATWMAVWMGGGLAVGLSLLQFPILSRSFEITSLLARWLGLLLGWALHVALDRVGGRIECGHDLVAALSEDHPLSPRMARIGIAMALAYLVFTGLSPFTLEVSRAQDAPWREIAPFHSMSLARFDRWLGDAVGKVAAFAALGACVTASTAFWWECRFGTRLARAVAACLCVGGAIELVQLFLPGRSAGLTDPALAFVGASVSVMLLEWHVRSALGAGTTGIRGTIRQFSAYRRSDSPPRSLTDELIGSLADPRHDAPRERGARRNKPEPD